MYGRLGGLYYLHLTEASAQRRRLAEAKPRPLQAKQQSSGPGLGMLARLAGVIGIGVGAIIALAMMVG